MKPKKLSNKHETFIAESLGGKTVIASGALYFAKGDVVTDDYLIECKATEKDYYILKGKILSKIENEALKCNRIPLLAIRVKDKDYIAYRAYDFYGYYNESDVLDCKESSKLSVDILNYIDVGYLYLYRFNGGAVWQITRLEDFKEVAVI